MRPKPSETRIELLAMGVASGLSLRRAAADAKIPEPTARRWIKDPGFQPRVKALREQMLSRAIGVLTAGAAAAATVLVKEAVKGDEGELRVKAARAVIADLITLAARSGGAAGDSQAPGVVIPGLDVRWQENGGPKP